jgi:hypothetical protein
VLGFRQDLQLTMVEQFPEGHETSDEHDQLGHVTFEPRPASPPNSTLQGLGYTARLRNRWPINSSASVELSLTGGTGRNTQPFACEAAGHYEPCPAGRGETGVNARQSLIGADVTVRWGSMLVQSEYMRQHNELPALPAGAPPQATYLGPTEDPAGAYVFAQWQLARRIFLGGRFDWVEEVVAPSRNFSAATAQLRFSPNELTKLLLAVERVRPGTSGSFNRLLLQVAVGAGTARQHEH